MVVSSSHLFAISLLKSYQFKSQIDLKFTLTLVTHTVFAYKSYTCIAYIYIKKKKKWFAPVSGQSSTSESYQYYMQRHVPFVILCSEIILQQTSASIIINYNHSLPESPSITLFQMLFIQPCRFR